MPMSLKIPKNISIRILIRIYDALSGLHLFGSREGKHKDLFHHRVIYPRIEGCNLGLCYYQF